MSDPDTKAERPRKPPPSRTERLMELDAAGGIEGGMEEGSAGGAKRDDGTESRTGRRGTPGPTRQK